MGAAMVLVGVIGVGDYVTGPDISFAVVYLIPVFLLATAGRAVRTAIVGAIALTWSLVEIALRSTPVPHGLVPALNGLSRFVLLWLFAALVSALAVKLADEQRLSRTDPLTRLSNARAFHETADAEIRRMRRAHRPLTVAYVDIDDFKAVNDAHGHSGGDDVLTLIAATMATGLRASDHIARLGGDEFAILLPETDLDGALVHLRRLHAKLQTVTAAYARPVGVSIGAVTFCDPPRSGLELVDAADRVMYKVKQHGKNRIWGERAGAQDSVAGDPASFARFLSGPRQPPPREWSSARS
jgi:diguanylate cyclase (GGDEF)-like protein